jgi:hypothetical protein
MLAALVATAGPVHAQTPSLGDVAWCTDVEAIAYANNLTVTSRDWSVAPVPRSLAYPCGEALNSSGRGPVDKSYVFRRVRDGLIRGGFGGGTSTPSSFHS